MRCSSAFSRTVTKVVSFHSSCFRVSLLLEISSMLNRMWSWSDHTGVRHSVPCVQMQGRLTHLPHAWQGAIISGGPNYTSDKSRIEYFSRIVGMKFGKKSRRWLKLIALYVGYSGRCIFLHRIIGFSVHWAVNQPPKWDDRPDVAPTSSPQSEGAASLACAFSNEPVCMA